MSVRNKTNYNKNKKVLENNNNNNDDDINIKNRRK